jgi:hypothetical protein
MGEGCEGRRLLWLPARRCLTGCVSHLTPLVLIVVAVKTEQLPVAPVGRIVVVVVVFVMDRELAQLLAVKFASAVRTDPGKHFERLFSIGLLQLSLGAPCHASLAEDGNLLLRDSTTSLSKVLKRPSTSCVVFLVHLVSLVNLVSFVQPNKRDKPNNGLCAGGLFQHPAK